MCKAEDIGREAKALRHHPLIPLKCAVDSEIFEYADGEVLASPLQLQPSGHFCTEYLDDDTVSKPELAIS